MNEIGKVYVVKWQNSFSFIRKDPFQAEWENMIEIFQNKTQAVNLVKELLLKSNTSSTKDITLETMSLKFEESINILNVIGINKMIKNEH